MESESYDFNCTKKDIDTLISNIDIYNSLAGGVHYIRQFCRDCSYSTSDSDYIEWVKQNIPCVGDGVIAREYISNSTILEGVISSVRCPTTATS